MAHKLPKPIFHAKCGTCFIELTWSEKLGTFECIYCMTKVLALSDNTFKTIYSSSLSVPCEQPPIESYVKVRHLREKDNKTRFFVVYSYLFYSCSLPKGHSSPHYHYYDCRYSEESLSNKEYVARDIPPD